MYSTRHCATDGQSPRLGIEPSMGNTTRCELGLIFAVIVVAGHLPDERTGRHCVRCLGLATIYIRQPYTEYKSTVGHYSRCDTIYIYIYIYIYISTHPVGFKPAVSATERPQTPALDSAVTGIPTYLPIYLSLFLYIYIYIYIYCIERNLSNYIDITIYYTISDYQPVCRLLKRRRIRNSWNATFSR